jgi:hypothetical protein
MDDFEEEYANLPDDPELAFAKFVKNREADLKRAYARLPDDASSNAFHNDELTFAIRVMAFHDGHDLHLIAPPKLEKWTTSFNTNFSKFRDDLEKVATEILIRHARRLKPLTSFVSVPDAIREQIHRHIEKVRKIIVGLKLTDDKREALLSKLQNFSAEVDADRTKLQAWAAFTIEVAKTAGAAAKEMAPVKEFIDSVGNLLGKAGDLMGLPGRKEPKQIEGPKKQLPKPKSDLDDEIPF